MKWVPAQNRLLQTIGNKEVGERGRNRTFNPLIKSTSGTKNQYFSAFWIRSVSLVKMRVSALSPTSQLNTSKRPMAQFWAHSGLANAP
jgi:hypothetical protein